MWYASGTRTCRYCVNLEQGIIALSFEDGDAAHDGVANEKRIIVRGAHNTVGAVDFLQDDFTSWTISEQTE